MAFPPDISSGAVIAYRELQFHEEGNCLVSRPVARANGAQLVAVDVVRVPAGQRWAPEEAIEEENTVVVFAGSGKGEVGGETAHLVRASALHAPTGSAYAVEATGADELTVYVWRSRLRPGRPRGTDPTRFNSLWNDETRLVGFTGYGQVDPAWKLASMNFLFWPGTGSAQLCLHCGIQEPGETFAVHIHPHSEEAFIAFEGVGQLYLRDRWIDVAAGDLLFAPPGLPHGARNPHTGPDARRFVCCGGPTPFDPFLYERAGVSTEVR